jgi:hypothetical protein
VLVEGARVRLDALFTPFVRRVLVNVALPVWFALLTAGHLAVLGLNAIGVDARIYYRGSELWLAGGNAWEAAAGFDGNVYHYAALPTTTVLFAPATVLPEDLFVALWLALGTVAAVWIVRVRLSLPWWWLAFPPLAEGIWSGNPGIVLLALVLSGRWWLEALAMPLKLYGAVPLAAQLRWRSLGGGAVLVLASIVIAPSLWQTFITNAGAITERLLAESAGGFGSNAWPLLFGVSVAAVAALALLDRVAAGWLAVPAFWPASEFHYSVLALPIMTPWLAAVLALPVRGLPALAILAYCGLRVGAAWRAGWRPGLESIRRPVPPPSSGPLAGPLPAGGSGRLAAGFSGPAR